MAGVTPPSSPVQPLETTEPSTGEHISHPRYGSPDYDSLAPIDAQESAFRHRAWASDRRKVYEALGRCHESQRRVDRFVNCGSSAWGGWCDGEPTITCNLCRDRLCQPCQVARRARLVEAICCRVADAHQSIRFMTFTTKHNSSPLSDQIDRLYASFRTLRRRPFWKQWAVGGALFLEVKVGRDGLYHPHLHVLVEGHWMDQKSLCAEWYAVTGDSFIVDVRSCPDARSRAGYVTKYATKPADSSILNVPAKLDEFLVAIKGRRLYQPFGTWTALLKDVDNDDAPRHIIPLGSIATICARARAGDHASRLWWSKATLRWPHLNVFAPHPTHTNVDPAPP